MISQHLLICAEIELLQKNSQIPDGRPQRLSSTSNRPPRFVAARAPRRRQVRAMPDLIGPLRRCSAVVGSCLVLLTRLALWFVRCRASRARYTSAERPRIITSRVLSGHPIAPSAAKARNSHERVPDRRESVRHRLFSSASEYWHSTVLKLPSTVGKTVV